MPNRKMISCLSATALLLAGCAAGGAGPGPTATVVAQGTAAGPAASASGCVVGVSWNSATGRFLAWDAPAVKDAVTAAGATYLETDALSSAATQATDVERLISSGATVLIILAQNGTAIETSVAKARAHHIPVIAYDRLIDDPSALYMTFDNVEVGRMQARALLAAVPKGRYAFIKGDKDDANSDFVRAGQAEVLAAAVKSGAIRNVGETYTKDWAGDLAMVEMELFLAANHNKVDAVLAQNDNLAIGVRDALAAHRLDGTAVMSGQDGDEAGLNAVARGDQTVDVWKDARVLGRAAGEAAVGLCGGGTIAGAPGVAPFTTPSGGTVSSVLLAPLAVTKDNLDEVLDAGWITTEVLCEGVAAASVAACP